MSEKRFFLMRKFLRKDKFHDIICHRVMDSKETEKTLNRLYGKYSSLKMENEQLKQQLKKDNDVLDNTKQKLRDREKAWGELFDDYIDVLKQKDGLERENEQLKSFIKKIMGISIIDKR